MTLGTEHLKPGENVFTWQTKKADIKELSALQMRKNAKRVNAFSDIAYSMAKIPKKVKK